LGRFGGGEKIAVLHSLYMKKMGLDVELFYNGPMPDEWKRRVQLGVPLKVLPFGLTKSIRELNKLMNHLKSFDIILVNHHICPFLAFYLSIFFKSKLVWYCGEPLRPLWENYISGIDYRELKCTVRSTSLEVYGSFFTSLFLSNGLYDMSVSFLKAVDKLTIPRFHTIVANSNYTREVVKRIYGLNGFVPVVYPGVERRLDSQNTASRNVRRYILSVGAMTPLKNHAALLKAFDILSCKRGLKVKLVIVGNGPLENELRSLARKFGLKNVIFESWVSERKLNNYYAGCMFIVHLAYHEPFGLVPIEAALHGKPSIVSVGGGTSEFVVHGKNGFVVDPNRPEEIADHIGYLIENGKIRAEMGLKAKERALKGFTIEKSTENLIRTIEARI